MTLTVRAKLFLIASATALAFGVVVISGIATNARQQELLTDLDSRLVPKLALAPRLAAQITDLRRTLQDAVAAQDLDGLDRAEREKAQVHATLDKAKRSLDAADVLAVRNALDTYYAIASDVSRRMIAGDAGEGLADAIAMMQERQQQLNEIVDRSLRIDPADVSDAFTLVRSNGDRTRTLNATVGLGLLVLVAVLSLWVGRGVLASVRALSNGLEVFATGKFDRPIVLTSTDEFSVIANAANGMAQRLKQHAAEREDADWMREARSELADRLRGRVDPRSVSNEALSTIAPRVGAVVGACYLTETNAELRLAASYGLTNDSEAPRETVKVGHGLAGQAATQDRLTVVDALPPDYLRVASSLGSGVPASLVLVPLARHGRLVGLFEFAFFTPCSARSLRFLELIGELVGATVEMAQSQASQKSLLEETQRLASRLTVQEEELRHNNHELRAQQEELQQANEELEAQRSALREQNTALDTAHQELQQKAEEVAKVSSYKSQFLANMSHELRTPLNSMLLLSNLLGDNEAGNLTAKQVEYCQTIHAAGQDLMALINQVLDLAKIEAGKQELAVGTVGVDALATTMRRLFDAQALDKGLNLKVEVDPGLPETFATDGKRLEQVLINLLGNAIKFTERGSVGLRIRRPERSVGFQRADLAPEGAIAFEVWDTGVGIPESAQEKVFLPFEQVEGRIDRRYGGTGLGLAIARESANLLGGELHLSSTVGRGSTFTCYLPLHAPSASVSPTPPTSSGTRTTLSIERGGHLLIIEDDAGFAEQLADIVRGRGLGTMVAGTGEEALRLAREGRPRGIVLDVRLPDTDGWTVFERLKRDPATAQIPVHFVSALDESERGLAMGAVGYLTKPTTRRQLNDLVTTLAKASGRGRVLVVEDNAAAAQSIVALLAKDGIDASHVPTATGALEGLVQGGYGCMVLDLGLPDIDGLRLLEILRERTDIVAPPVVIYTGRTLTRDEVRRLEAYAIAVVLKDGHSEERLIEEVRLFVQHVKDARLKQQARTDVSVPPSTTAALTLTLSGRRIILVDDDMRTLYALSALLHGKGAEVISADNGRRALEVLDAHPHVDGVLMDVMMPEMDGYEAMRRIRAQARFKNLPVVALTARAMAGERDRCIEAGASDYLPKPVDGPALLAIISKWAKRAS